MYPKSKKGTSNTQSKLIQKTVPANEIAQSWKVTREMSQSAVREWGITVSYFFIFSAKV